MDYTNEPKTVNGVLIAELDSALGRILPAQAYKEIVGTRKKGMTDTKSQWIFLRLDEIFGAAGFGWWTEFVNPANAIISEFDDGIRELSAGWKKTENRKVWDQNAGDGKGALVPAEQTITIVPDASAGKLNKSPWTSVTVVKFFYRYQVGDQVFTSHPVVGTGGISMDRRDFSERGAYTNALGDALKMLGWQRGLWFDKFNHDNAAEKYAAQQAKAEEWRSEGKHVPGDPVGKTTWMEAGKKVSIETQ